MDEDAFENTCGNRKQMLTLAADNSWGAYLCAMYWTLQTLPTIGYGDMTPHSNKERAYTTFIFTIGTCIFTVISGK